MSPRALRLATAVLALAGTGIDPGRSVAAFVSLVGFGFSAWLTYVELVEIEAVCQWCVASAVVMTALALLSVTRMLRRPVAA